MDACALRHPATNPISRIQAAKCISHKIGLRCVDARPCSVRIALKVRMRRATRKMNESSETARKDSTIRTSERSRSRQQTRRIGRRFAPAALFRWPIRCQAVRRAGRGQSCLPRFALKAQPIKLSNRNVPTRPAATRYRALLTVDQPLPQQPINHVIAAVQKLAGLSDGERLVGSRRSDPQQPAANQSKTDGRKPSIFCKF